MEKIYIGHGDLQLLGDGTRRSKMFRNVLFELTYSYASFTEYGTPPPTNTVDSTATVIDDSMKALPSPLATENEV